MRRYYSGDIEGKFMFGVQSSTAADRFGSTYSEPNYVDYYFNEDQLEEIKEQLELLHPVYQKISLFFETHNGFNRELMADYNITDEEMSDYADYDLGLKILNCIVEYGECNFRAEL